jgi:hypothetical protein
VSKSVAFDVDAAPAVPGELRVALPSLRDEWLTLWLPELVFRDLPGRTALPDRPSPVSPLDETEAWSLFTVMSMFGLPEWRTTPWTRDRLGGVTRSLDFGDGRVSASATPLANELLLEVTVANTSSQVWLDCYAMVCLRFAPSPAFADIRGDRTFVRIDGTWSRVSETGIRNAMSHTEFQATHYRPVQSNELVDRWDRFRELEVSARLDHPLIATSNRDGTAVVGLLFERTAQHFHNRAGNMACVHSDPLLGDIEPGAARTMRGKLVYFEGSTADFLETASAIRV